MKTPRILKTRVGGLQHVFLGLQHVFLGLQHVFSGAAHMASQQTPREADADTAPRVPLQTVARATSLARPRPRRACHAPEGKPYFTQLMQIRCKADAKADAKASQKTF